MSSDTTEYAAQHAQSSTPPKEVGPVLRVNEIFGPTFQGEGIHAGRHCLFIRLYDCNLSCSWCDTAYTWANTPDRARLTRSQVLYPKQTEEHLMSVDDVIQDLQALWPTNQRNTIIVISGGEPMMQQKALEPLVASLALRGNEVHIETAGTIQPNEMFNRYIRHYTVSPKLANSSNRLNKRYKPDVLQWFAQETNAWFKFVVVGEAELEEVDQIVLNCHINPQVVQIMPEGTTPHNVIAGAYDLEPAVLRRGYGMSLRNHVLVHGDKRGK